MAHRRAAELLLAAGALAPAHNGAAPEGLLGELSRARTVDASAHLVLGQQSEQLIAADSADQLVP